MVRSVAGNLPEQVKNNQSVNTAAGNGGQKMSQYSWFTVYYYPIYYLNNFYYDESSRNGSRSAISIREDGHMKLLFKQRFFSWLDSYDIYDEYENTVYLVKGQLAWGHCLKIFDAHDRELGMVKERVLTFLPKFEVYEGNQMIGSISKELTFLKSRYNIDFNGWHIEGNWTEWNYSITDGAGRTVAVISKEIFHMTDTYVLDIANPGDALHVLMFTLAIDAEKCSRQ